MCRPRSGPLDRWALGQWRDRAVPCLTSPQLSSPRPGLGRQPPGDAAGACGELHPGAVPLPTPGCQGSKGVVPGPARGMPALGDISCESWGLSWQPHISHWPGGRPAPGGDGCPAGRGCWRVWLCGGGLLGAPDGAQGHSGCAPCRWVIPAWPAALACPLAPTCCSWVLGGWSPCGWGILAKCPIFFWQLCRERKPNRVRSLR